MTDFQVVQPNGIVADTIVKLIIDGSGSMADIRDDTIGGHNTYINELRGKVQGRTLVSLYVFDHAGETRIRRVYLNKPLDEVKNLTRADYVPDGGTPLFDTVGRIIKETEVEVAGMTNKPSVLFMIQTDGMNNIYTK